MAVYPLVTSEGSAFHIVTARYGSETERFAASELQKYLYRSTGVCIPYFADGCPCRGPEIRIGANVRGEQISLDTASEEGYTITGDGTNLWIAGRTPRGTLYGVYRFLELFLGFRCFSDEVETICHMQTLTVEEPHISEDPAFDYREMYYRPAFSGNFASKNRLNSNMADLSREKGGNLKFYNFHHAFYDLVKPEEWFATHPEYFAQIDGVRTVTDSQLCLSNPAILPIAKKTLRNWIRENPHCRVFSVAQNDSRRYCTCPACRRYYEQDGSPAGLVIRFANALCEDLEQDYPDILLHTFAYFYSVKCPRGVKPHKNLIVRLCNIDASWHIPFLAQEQTEPDSHGAEFVRNIREWSAICDRLYIWDYCVNFRNYLQPFVHYRTLAENLRAYRALHVKGVLEQGDFSYGAKSAFGDLKCYLTAKLLWDPSQDVDVLIDEFTKACYGDGAPYLAAYVRMLMDAAPNQPLTIYANPDIPLFSETLLVRAEILFAKALSATTGDAHRRVEKEYLSLRFLHLARLPLDAPCRAEQIDAFFDDLAKFGITEISERCSLAASREDMKQFRFMEKMPHQYRLYYVMQ